MDAQKLIKILESKADWWRNNQNDPHNVGNAVQVAIREVADAIRQEERDHEKH